MTTDISVIICSHNPQDRYLSRVLAALKSQTLPLMHWELLIVDNASDYPISQRWDIAWHPHARHITEPRLGLTHARLTGIRAAQSPLLLFLDDDNVPVSNYLEQAVRIAIEKPSVGVFGAGTIEPEFELAPVTELEPYFPFLAIRSVEQSVEKVDPSLGLIPCGAGLCVRADVAQQYSSIVSSCPVRSALGRTGARLLSGEDDEFSWVAQAMGCRHAIYKELRLLHLIDGRRVQVPYLEGIIHGSGYSSAMLAQAHGRSERNPYAIPSLSNCFSLIRRLEMFHALLELYRWVKFRCRSQIARRFATALANGWNDGQADYHARIAPLISTGRQEP
ncbi:MAG: glycosyltransferase [Rhodocyclaceae bacterium]